MTPVLILMATAAFDTGSCEDTPTGPKPDPIREDYEVPVSELFVLVYLDYDPRRSFDNAVAVSVDLVRNVDEPGYQRGVNISDSRFLVDGIPLVYHGGQGFPLSAANTLTYIDVSGESHEIPLPLVPDTFVDETRLPVGISRSEPLEVFWDGDPIGPAVGSMPDEVRVYIQQSQSVSEGEGVSELGATSVVISAAKLEGLSAGDGELVLQRGTVQPNYPGTNGGAVMIEQTTLPIIVVVE